MIIAEKFIRSLVSNYGKHIVYTDEGTWYNKTCVVIGLKHCLYWPFQKNFMERISQYLNDRIESFEDYYPCMQEEYNLLHVHN